MRLNARYMTQTWNGGRVSQEGLMKDPANFLALVYRTERQRALRLINTQQWHFRAYHNTTRQGKCKFHDLKKQREQIFIKKGC